MKRVAMLISGTGTNMVKLCQDMVNEHPARPVLVVSNKPEAAGLARAAEMNVPTAVVDHRPFGKDRPAFEAELKKALDAAEPDIICFAGFMRILAPEFITHYKGRMLNTHPSLLPKYPGLNTHARAIEAGDDVAGCTVHEVTEILDGGPILGQAHTNIAPDDTPDTLAAKVLKLEHRLYPAALQRFALGNKEPFKLL